MRPVSGLLGRIFAILLLTIAIEFTVSTLMFDRASQLRVDEDEAHRVAEHLAIANRVLAEHPQRERAELAIGLSSRHFAVRWHPVMPSASSSMTAELPLMREQILSWEPTLVSARMRLLLDAPGRDGMVRGEMQLRDGSWIAFYAPQLVNDRKFRFTWMLMALVLAAALVLIGGLLIRRTLDPMRTLARAADRIGHGEEVPLTEFGGTEVRRLVRAFNEMQARIHRLITDRVEALAAVGHDLRTPLARLRLRAETISQPELRGSIDADLAEMEGMVASLLAYLGGEDDPERLVRTDIAVMAATLVDDITDRGGLAHYAGPDHLERMVRPISFKRAVANLVENAFKYGDRVWVSLSAGADGIVLRVEDNGPGISEDQLDKVLQPFVRLDSARGRDTGGLGLGLAIATRAVELEGGTLRLRNRVQGGLCAEIQLAAA